MDKKVHDVVLDSITEGVFTVDSDWKVTYFNHAAEKITGVPRQEAIGRLCREVLRADACESGCALRETLASGCPILNKPVHIIDADGKQKSITISTALLKDNNGRVIGGVETFRDTTLVEQLRKQLRKQFTFEDIVSRNHKIQEIFDVLPQIAQSDCTVLIEGSTGTGKELFARAIHSLSGRKTKPFIAVNCGALPDALLESELFGYKAGAFTDAKKDKPGRFKLAEGGTLFLDEIGDISPAVQVKLLRVLQEKTYEPVGGVTTEKANARIITATNKNLVELIGQDRFRSDLYYRVNVVKITLPPLNQRREDIPLLVDYFISRFNALYNKSISGLSDDVISVLLMYDFPGNIRELENIIEHCFVLCQGDIIEGLHLPSFLRQTQKSTVLNKEGQTLEQIEVMMIQQTLDHYKGNRTAAAKALGINASTLFRKLKKLNLHAK